LDAVKLFISLYLLLSMPGAAHASGIGSHGAHWLTQLPAQAIVLMMAAFVIWGFVKRRCRGEFDN
jgi:hypothetical protein